MSLSTRRINPMTAALWRRLLICGLFWGACQAIPANAEEPRWWPVQGVPKGVLRTGDMHGFPPPSVSHQMMVQSVAGLAAKAVNEGRGDEMVWVGSGNFDIEDWFGRLGKRHPGLETRGLLSPWELVDRFVKEGVIRGYILYRRDPSSGDINAYRKGMDVSVNVATSLAGVLDGIIVDEELEGEAKKHGLKLLADAREKTQAWCFETYRDQFNRRMLCTQDPRKPHTRDLAIAQKAFTMFGAGEPLDEAMRWLEPLSPIVGWNGGDEFESTRISTIHGHIQTATDWCMNLPVLMAGTEKVDSPRIKAFDPKRIDWNDNRGAVSFVSSDGDNVQWLEGGFFRSIPSFWASIDRGRFPYGWSSCFAHLAQLCPEAIDYASATQLPNDTFVEWGGGYYYPDLFGLERANRWDLLAKHAARTREWMRRNNTRIIGFNMAKVDSPDALKSYEVFAGATEGLLAIFVFQYAPYEGGAGKTFWVKDKAGVEIPVISARYSVWEHANERALAGTPAKVARLIEETVASTPPADGPRFDWAIDHAWSYFRKVPGNAEDAENMPQEGAESRGGLRGYTPFTWCAERLPERIRVVSPEELAWRIRMKHDPEPTKKAIDASRD
ncbi:hypothetical protein [Singulisphaera sp. PoT]|uniref:hypothetical protein n=1 Tax=Singulisphaera sp. PoT TaxID=3411797 RepID=UPI003BF4DAAC